MKFSLQLEEYTVPAWKQYYFPYKALKKWLEELACPRGPSSSNAPGSPRSSPKPRWYSKAAPSETSDAESCDPPNGYDSGTTADLLSPGTSAETGDALKLQRISSPGPRMLRRTISPSTESWANKFKRRGSLDYLCEGPDDASLTPEEMWHVAVERAAMQAGSFVEETLQGVQRQLTDLSQMATTNFNESGKDKTLELRFLDAIGRVKETVDQLKGFAEINHAAIYKIMKKHDKLFKTDQGMTVRFPKIIMDAQLSSTSSFDAMAAQVRQLTAKTSFAHCEQSFAVTSLAAGLRTGGHAGASLRERRADQWLFFFMGCFISLTFCICILISLPAYEPDPDNPTFYAPYFLSPFPVFQVILCVILALWACGFVTRCCDSNSINHMFLLGIDPRCRVGPTFFFARAAVLSSCWVLTFGMYVVDYKWEVIPHPVSSAGYNARSSWHFVLYPSLMVVITIVGLGAPSLVCVWKYRSAFAQSVWRTMMAPLFFVSFADNVVGDAITSFSKPLQFIPGAFCYLASAHPQTKEAVDGFDKNADVCPAWEHAYLKPVIAGLPYWFRAMQCLRRYRDTKEPKHLCNFGKYCASLLVVVVGAFALDIYGKKGGIVYSVSIFATLYSYIWDLTMDWGLTLNDVKLWTWDSSDSRPLDVTARNHLDLSSAGGTERLTRGDSHIKQERHFSAGIYLLAALFDLFARFAWVQTLLPSGTFTKKIAGREVITMSTASLEIARRSVWAVLRLEWEQVSNAGGFRTLLWVPAKLNSVSKAARPISPATHSPEPQRKEFAT